MNPLVSLLVILSLAWGWAPGATALAQPADSKPLKYFIVVTGGELLEGVYPDAHTPFLTRTLRPLGAQCAGSLTVDDNLADIQNAVRFATNRASLVIVTGGLGPTPNDITRETLSDLTGVALQESSDVLADMERRFQHSRDQLRPNLRRQALVPTQGGYLRNPNGTAVGLIFEWAGVVLVALPGPPRELQPMTTGELVPFLQRRFGVREFGCSLTLRFVGAGQSLIDQTIKDHISVPPGVVITSLFEGSRVDFTFSLPGNSPDDRARLEQLEDDIRGHLGSYIYADDGSSLEAIVARNMRRHGGSLVLVEMGTGGSVAAALSGIRDSSDLLRGAYVGLTEQDVARLLDFEADKLPEQVLERTQALATAAASKTGSRWAVAISPVQSEPSGSKSLVLTCRSPSGHWQSDRITLRDLGEISRGSVATQILELLRKYSTTRD